MQEAEFHFDYALQLIESEAMPSFKYHAYLMAADFYIAKRDYGQANNMIEMANKNISEIRTYPTSLLTNVRRIPIYLAQNDILASNRSKRILKDASLSPSVDIKHNVSYSIALVLYANEDYEEAVSVLLMLLKALEGTHFEDAKLRACVLLALSQYRNNDIQEGMKTLNIALQVSAYENYQRLFLKAPEPIKEMLEKALEQKGLNRVIHKYVDELVRQLNEQNISVTPNFLLSEESAMPTGENKFALTDREREILNLIAQGYSNQQIEKNLYISINTVKKHLKNLYRKLDVSSRTQAITAGRRANLIR